MELHPSHAHQPVITKSASIFRKDINGLRAIAVLAVVFYHFNVPLFSSGFVGVDIFFVISGFLMTGIILRRQAEHNLSIMEFFLDRALRIFPALIALCFALLVFGWFWLIPADYEALGKHVASSLTFVSNIIYWRETGFYGDLASQDKWLLHTWSLSVEWQFYVIFPFFILALKRLAAITHFPIILAMLTAISLGISCILTPSLPAPSFYLLPTRAWELFAGGLIYLWSRPHKLNTSILELGGLLLILYSIFFINSLNDWPGYKALTPVIGAVLIIAANNQGSFLTSNRLFQFIGSASYSIYLWHWPIVVALSYKGLLTNPLAVTTGILVSILIGFCSLILIENPTRKRLRLAITSPTKLLICLIAAASIVILAGYVIFVKKGIVGDERAINQDDRSVYLQHYRNLKDNTNELYRLECSFLNRREIGAHCSSSAIPKGIFLWGDSHAQHLAHGILQILDNKLTLAQVTTSGCRPSLTKQVQHDSFKEACDRSNEFAIKEIERLQPSIVILAQKDGHLNTDWTTLASKLKTLGVEKIILIGPVPQWHPSLPIIMTRRHWGILPDYINDGLILSILDEDMALKKIYKNSSSIDYVSMIDALCNNKKCLATVPQTNELTAIDYGHFSAENSVFTVSILLGSIIASQSQ